MKEFGYDKQYDVIVAGGGVSGTVAAIAPAVWERMS